MLDVSKPRTYNAYDAPHQDLREFVARIEASKCVFVIAAEGGGWRHQGNTVTIAPCKPQVAGLMRIGRRWPADGY
jgi:hypothetical protein